MAVLESVALPAVLDSLEELRACARRSAEAVGLEAGRSYGLQLAVDEIATNVINYGYGAPDASRHIWMSTEATEDALVVRLEDEGTPFDPREHELPSEEDLSAPLETRAVGGLGIMLALRGVDEFDYLREGGRNANVFRMRLGHG